ncbi:hypothetical protein NX059_000938 [Plenodomus lindquistii]|nr:hypothetical protein NX059_000938 [Plenodomus lindquistii]
MKTEIDRLTVLFARRDADTKEEMAQHKATSDWREANTTAAIDQLRIVIAQREPVPEPAKRKFGDENSRPRESILIHAVDDRAHKQHKSDQVETAMRREKYEAFKKSVQGVMEHQK